MDNLDLSKASLDDIVFEQRNKSYGAYLLRKLYDKNVSIAAAISIAVFTLALSIPSIVRYFSPKEEVVVVEDIPEEVTIIDVPLDPKAPPPPPIEQPPPPEIKTVKFIPPEPAPDPEVNEPPPPSQEKLETSNISNENREGKDTLADIPEIPVGPVGNGVGDEEEGLWMGPVSKQTTFPGGRQAMYNFYNNNLSQRARDYIAERQIKGAVQIYFEVEKDGTLSNVKIVEGREIVGCKICSEEVLRITKEMPKWEPAESNGRAVKVRVSYPVKF